MNVRVSNVTEKGVMQASADVLIVPVLSASKEKKPAWSPLAKHLDVALQNRMTDVCATTDFTGAFGQTFFIDAGAGVKAKRLLLLGVGEAQELTHEKIRRAFGTAAMQAKTVHAQSVAVFVDDIVEIDAQEVVAQAVTEGMALALYRFLKYKKEDQKQWSKSIAKTCTLLTLNKKYVAALQKGAKKGSLTAEATMLARDLVNEPAVHMTPASLAKAAKNIAQADKNIRLRILNEAQAKKLGMGSFLSVAAGSDEEAQFIHLHYVPQTSKGVAKKSVKKLVVCGKGITFDSGGLSIKPSPSMHEMKMDMAGAAAVLGLFSIISRIAPNVEVHGVIPATENMPSGKATRPGDVVTAYDGTTIEITNTDAEGRLVLADAIAWAVDTIKPDYIIDLATLTGAALVAVGQEIAPFYSTNDEFKTVFEDATKASGELVWELPLVEEYEQLLKSPIADVDNSPSTYWAGSIIGALFLKRFAKKTPWIHVDIAGPAMVSKQMLPYAPAGGAGFGVRTLVALVERIS